MRRTRAIRTVFLGLSVVGLLTGCGPRSGPKKSTTSSASTATPAERRVILVDPSIIDMTSSAGTYQALNGAAPPPGTQLPDVAGAQAVGSRFWYENDAYGYPFKTHTAAEAQLAAALLQAINAERAKQGVPALTSDADGEKAAKAHSEDMVARQYFDHVSPEGWTPDDRLRMVGASGYNAGGENIITGAADAAQLVASWMTSAPHRANILSPTFNHMGVGVKLVGPNAVATTVFLGR